MLKFLYSVPIYYLDGKTSKGNNMNNKTAQVLKSMFLENTGKALCDSGDHYGRHWEINNKAYKENKAYFDNQKELEVSYDGELEVKVSLYHWLLEKVTYNADMQKKYNAFRELFPDKTNPKEFIEFITEEYPIDCLCYSEDYTNSEGIYTYNMENYLLQDFIYYTFTVDLGYGLEHFALISIHNGCDARGGFTDYKCFFLGDYVFDLRRLSTVTVIDDSGNEWISYDAGYSYSVARDKSNVESLESYELSTDDQGNVLSPVDQSVLQIYCS